MKEKIKELDSLLEKKLLNYGLKKKKNTYIKNAGEGIYGISLATTKVKGQEKIHFYVMLTLNFEHLNNLIMYLRYDYSYEGWESIAVNAVNILQSDNPFSFYIDKDKNLEFAVNKLIENLKHIVCIFLMILILIKNFKANFILMINLS